MDTGPRIVLFHALRDSQVPAWEAFAEAWPEAETYNLLDDSLSADLAADRGLTPAMLDRFSLLARYVASAGGAQRPTAGILYTCSAFGPAIARVAGELAIPVLRPNEAGFEDALACGPRIGLVVSFPGALPPLVDELRTMAAARGQAIELHTMVADGALAALQAGDGARHDALVAQAAQALPPLDALVLCQFSLARARHAIPAVRGRTVVTTPLSAVRKMRRLVQARAG